MLYSFAISLGILTAMLFPHLANVISFACLNFLYLLAKTFNCFIFMISSPHSKHLYASNSIPSCSIIFFFFSIFPFWHTGHFILITSFYCFYYYAITQILANTYY